MAKATARRRRGQVPTPLKARRNGGQVAQDQKIQRTTDEIELDKKKADLTNQRVRKCADEVQKILNKYNCDIFADAIIVQGLIHGRAKIGPVQPQQPQPQ